MADRMSHDPDRDARQIAALVSLLERHGLLRRTESVMEPNFRAMAQCLSAMSNTRREFVSSTKSFVAELDLHFSEDGRRIGIQEGLEALWLTWSCGFEGEGLDVEIYDPIGGHQYCVRCGFSTLDDRMENDHWRRGCPECGWVSGVSAGHGRWAERCTCTCVSIPYVWVTFVGSSVRIGLRIGLRVGATSIVPENPWLYPVQ